MWTDVSVQHRHYYYLSWGEPSIALQPGVQYRIFSSIATRKEDNSLPEGCYVEVKHLVQACGAYPVVLKK